MYIAFVVTCKGRLHHLKETLPLIVKQEPDEIVVVDYGCPDGTAAWVAVNFPRVKIVQFDSPSFNVSHARNLGRRRYNRCGFALLMPISELHQGGLNG